ncbi:large ribosomal subunit protein mL66 isoform X2 [Prorops nasuta]|uniref:large ribosomal subunit protein mL66 isoform X2 n=1 Tax=Prorops nasuta TaxID=863751 RepID=UPI0034CD7CE7
MALISDLFRKCAIKLYLQPYIRNISLSTANQLKKIVETKDGDNLIIEGQIYIDERENRLIKSNENGACLLCSTGLQLKHTDVLILSQFLRSDGCMLPRRITGLCRIQQKRVGIMVAMAQKAAYMF